MASLWRELKRRNVVRVAMAYVIVSWLILQLTDVLVPLLTLPEWVGRLVFLMLLVGFPLALFFAWAFELTPEGLKKEKDVDRSASITHETGRKLDRTIIAVLLVALVVFAFERFILLPDRATPTGTGEEIVASVDQPSIAVLPFVNMSSDPEQEYFSDGLSEEILNLLAKIPELKVIGRTSSFAFKGKNEDLRVIGEALGVNTVLEGSVRKSGDRIRITAQLIDVSDGAHLWSETYDRTMTDVFEIQDNVAGEIIEALKLHVGAMPQRGRPTNHIEAYSLFLKARAAVNRWEIPEAIDSLKKAVEYDPNFADAFELLAVAYWAAAGTTTKGAEGQRLVFAMARRALAINPDLVLAQSLATSGDIDNYSFLREIEALERVVRLQPGETNALQMLSYDLIEAGYLREAIGVAQKLVELEPLSVAAYARLSESLLGVNRNEEALNALEVAIELGGDVLGGGKAFQLVLNGRIDEAIPHLAAWFEWHNVPPELAHDFIKEGRRADTGAKFLDKQIRMIVGSVPDESKNNVNRLLIPWYGALGQMDRYFEIILEIDANASTWTAADDLMFFGTMMRGQGFTSHPNYLVAAEAIGIVDLWEQRGSPDFCEKANSEWVCE
jgi:TolB-like protein/Flp pilus assembly protein TadD